MYAAAAEDAAQRSVVRMVELEAPKNNSARHHVDYSTHYGETFGAPLTRARVHVCALTCSGRPVLATSLPRRITIIPTGPLTTSPPRSTNYSTTSPYVPLRPTTSHYVPLRPTEFHSTTTTRRTWQSSLAPSASS